MTTTTTTNSCWYCQRRDVTGSTSLGPNPGRRVRVPICDNGTGCRDGRIYHGPLALPHQPGEPCQYCTSHRRH